MLSTSILLRALFLCPLLCMVIAQAEDSAPKELESTFVDFLDACTSGRVDQVRVLLDAHPAWIHERSESGETCLHVAGIYGQAMATALLLERGADPNVRSTFAKGLRMTPLAWNAYAGNVATLQVLLDHSDILVNLDFDAMGAATDPPRKVTAYDVASEILDQFGEEDQADPRYQSYADTKELLKRYGGQRFADLLTSGSPTNTDPASNAREDL
jgi:ankyrin repeat protein